MTQIMLNMKPDKLKKLAENSALVESYDIAGLLNGEPNTFLLYE